MRATGAADILKCAFFLLGCLIEKTHLLGVELLVAHPMGCLDEEYVSGMWLLVLLVVKDVLALYRAYSGCFVFQLCDPVICLLQAVFQFGYVLYLAITRLLRSYAVPFPPDFLGHPLLPLLLLRRWWCVLLG